MYGRIISDFETNLSTLCLLGIVLTILLNVAARIIFNYPFMWTLELCSILVIWSVYWSFGINYKSGLHLSVDALITHLPRRFTNFLDIFKDIIIFVTIVIIITSSVVAIKINFSITTNVLEVSVGLAYYLAVLIGSLSMLSYILHKYYRKIRGEAQR